MSDDTDDRKDGVARPSPIDVHVGSRIRLRRTLMGLSQERLGEALGLTFQQVQKYERGTNRVGASRLFDLAHILGVEVGFFYEDMPDATRADRPSVSANAAGFGPPVPNSAEYGVGRGGFAEAQAPFSEDLLHRRETLELVRTYYRIVDPATRRKVFELIKTMAPKTE